MNSGIYKRNLLLPSVKIVIDFLVVILAVVWSFYLRFYLFFTKIIPVRDNYIPPFENYIYFAIILGIIYIILFGIYRSYKSRISSTFPQEIPLVFKVNVLAILVTFTLAFFYRGFSYSRVVFILVFINTAILLLIGRYIFHRYRNRFISKGYNTIRVIIVGSEKIVSRVYHKIKEDRNYNFDMKGYVSSKHDKDLSIPYLGDFANIPSLLKNNDLDGVIVSFSHKEHDLILPVIQQTEGKNIEIFYVPDILTVYCNTKAAMINFTSINIYCIKSITTHFSIRIIE